MRAVLAGLFLVLPIVELYVIIQVGQAVGVLPTILLMFAIPIGGSWLVRREGGRTWRAFRGEMAAGRVPGREVADGALVLLAGALLVTPGFVTDVFALVLLVPPGRAMVCRLVVAWAARRVGVTGYVVEGSRVLHDRRPTQRVRSRRGPGTAPPPELDHRDPP